MPSPARLGVRDWILTGSCCLGNFVCQFRAQYVCDGFGDGGDFQNSDMFVPMNFEHGASKGVICQDVCLTVFMTRIEHGASKPAGKLFL